MAPRLQAVPPECAGDVPARLLKSPSQSAYCPIIRHRQGQGIREKTGGQATTTAASGMLLGAVLLQLDAQKPKYLAHDLVRHSFRDVKEHRTDQVACRDGSRKADDKLGFQRPIVEGYGDEEMVANRKLMVGNTGTPPARKVDDTHLLAPDLWDGNGAFNVNGNTNVFPSLNFLICHCRSNQQ